MVFNLLMGLFSGKTQAALVQKIFSTYLESYREYLKIMERRAYELSPDLKVAWSNVIKLQHLLFERQAMRFEYLLQANQLDAVSLESLDSVGARIENEWAAAEESLLSNCDSIYRDLSQEITDMQSTWDSDALGNSCRIVDQDPQYRDALAALATKVKELNDELHRCSVRNRSK